VILSQKIKWISVRLPFARSIRLFIFSFRRCRNKQSEQKARKATEEMLKKITQIKSSRRFFFQFP